MYRVIAIDDEIWTLRGLSKIVDWNKFGFEYVAGYTDSITALDKILEIKPDIMITDIRMAGLNGLDLIRSIQARGLSPAIILISAYSDFSYAQEAIRLKVYDYIVKPVQQEKIKKLLMELKTRLDCEQKSLHEDYIYKYITDQHELSDKVLLDLLELKESYNGWLCICIKKNAQNTKEISESMIDTLEIDTINFSFFDILNRFTIGVFNCDPEEYQSVLKHLEQFANGNRLYVGVSDVFNQICFIDSAVNQAKLSLLESYVKENSYFIIYRAENEEYIRSVTIKLQALFNNRQLELIIKFIMEIPSLLRINQLSIVGLYKLYNSLTSMIWKLQIENAIPLEKPLFFSRPEDVPERFQTLEDLCASLIGTVKNTFKYLLGPVAQSSEEGNSIFNIKKYVDDHFAEDISLQSLAQFFHIDITYLSHLFKEKIGITISHYITKARMEYACSLLINTKLQVNEISTLSGYDDYFYFSKVFKKNMGLTPSEYRRRKEGRK